MDILDYCLEKKESQEIDRFIQEKKEFYPTVYTAVEYRKMLEGAGALEFVPSEDTVSDAQEDEASEDAESDLDSREEKDSEEVGLHDEVGHIDKEGYLIPGKERIGMWLTTNNGRAYLETINDTKRFAQLLKKEQCLGALYITVLELCNTKPQSIEDLDKQLRETLSALQQKRNAGYFVERLEKYDLLKWQNKWAITDFGKACLAQRNSDG